MANTYLLNGTVSPLAVTVNSGDPIKLEPLNFQNPSLAQTAKIGLASTKSAGVLGIGTNQVTVSVNGGPTIFWKVELVSPPVTVVLDVQLIIFGNELQGRNTTSTNGITITKDASGGKVEGSNE